MSASLLQMFAKPHKVVLGLHYISQSLPILDMVIGACRKNKLVTLFTMCYYFEDGILGLPGGVKRENEVGYWALRRGYTKNLGGPIRGSDELISGVFWRCHGEGFGAAGERWVIDIITNYPSIW